VSAWQFARISLQHISEGDLDGRYTFFFACLVGFFVQVLVLLSIIRTSCADPWWKIGMGFATLGIFLGLPVWSGYWAFCRVLLPLTIAFNLLLPRNRYFWPIWVMGNLTMLHAIWRFVGTSLLKN
jgi:hypothetical protein